MHCFQKTKGIFLFVFTCAFIPYVVQNKQLPFNLLNVHNYRNPTLFFISIGSVINLEWWWTLGEPTVSSSLQTYSSTLYLVVLMRLGEQHQHASHDVSHEGFVSFVLCHLHHIKSCYLPVSVGGWGEDEESRINLPRQILILSAENPILSFPLQNTHIQIKHITDTDV